MKNTSVWKLPIYLYIASSPLSVWFPFSKFYARFNNTMCVKKVWWQGLTFIQGLCFLERAGDDIPFETHTSEPGIRPDVGNFIVRVHCIVDNGIWTWNIITIKSKHYLHCCNDKYEPLIGNIIVMNEPRLGRQNSWNCFQTFWAIKASKNIFTAALTQLYQGCHIYLYVFSNIKIYTSNLGTFHSLKK